MDDSVNFYLKIKKQDIVLYTPFFDAFEGMLAVRTPDPPQGEYGVLQVMVAPSFVNEFSQVIKRLGLEQTSLEPANELRGSNE